MASFMSSTWGCMTDCLFVVSRVLLFCSCLLMAIYHAAFILLPHSVADDDQRPTGEAANLTTSHKFLLYFMSGIMLFVSLCGLHGNFTRDPRSLKLFALLITMVALLHSVTLYNKYSENDIEMAKFNTTMKQARLRYDFVGTDPNAATTLWDTAQSSLGCCGLSDSYEWLNTMFKPAYYDAEVMPKSCCPSLAMAKSPDGRCRFQFAYQVGCLEQYQKYLSATVRAGILDNLVYVSLAILALYVAEYKTSASRSRTIADQYSQFDGSVYLSRPYHQMQMPAHYNEKPPAYVISSAPPPSYALS